MTNEVRLHESSGRIVRPGTALRRLQEASRPKRDEAARYRELAEAMRGLGLSPHQAHHAVLGREADQTGMGPQARGFSAAQFAYAADDADDTTWFGQLYAFPDDTRPDTALVDQAVKLFFNASGDPAYLGAVLSTTDVAKVRKKLSAAWDEAWAGKVMPPAKPGAIA